MVDTPGPEEAVSTPIVLTPPHDAVGIVRFYIRQAWEKAGLTWTQANEDELRAAIESVNAGTGDATT